MHKRYTVSDSRAPRVLSSAWRSATLVHAGIVGHATRTMARNVLYSEATPFKCTRLAYISFGDMVGC